MSKFIDRIESFMTGKEKCTIPPLTGDEVEVFVEPGLPLETTASPSLLP